MSLSTPSWVLMLSVDNNPHKTQTNKTSRLNLRKVLEAASHHRLCAEGIPLACASLLNNSIDVAILLISNTKCSPLYVYVCVCLWVYATECVFELIILIKFKITQMNVSWMLLEIHKQADINITHTHPLVLMKTGSRTHIKARGNTSFPIPTPTTTSSATT